MIKKIHAAIGLALKYGTGWGFSGVVKMSARITVNGNYGSQNKYCIQVLVSKLITGRRIESIASPDGKNIRVGTTI